MLSVYILSYLLMVISISFRWKDMESNSDILIFWYSYSCKTRDYIEANKNPQAAQIFPHSCRRCPCPHGAWRRQHLLWRVGPGWKMLDHRLVPCIFLGSNLDSRLKHWKIIHHVFWTIISVALSCFSTTSELQVVIWAERCMDWNTKMGRLSLLALSAIIYYSVSGGPYGAEVCRGFPSKYLQGMNHESWTVCIQYISWMVGD